ncbi:MAG: class I SAM-dependent methyltransferase [Chloroflexi bacterium]|nr:MAG: class I SAM-dependent methyltransferase [Chloroflexota bacterium]
MAKCKYYNFDAIVAQESMAGLEGKVATHHLKLYHLVSAMQRPVVLEFGVDKGRSTCILLHACESSGGHLYSVDIKDCADVAQSEAWTFIQHDDRSRDAIMRQHPALKDGIDLLHIDSRHNGEHVATLLMTWFPYLKAGSYITLHDIDPTPYLPSQRKDNVTIEHGIRQIANTVQQFFYANEDELFLEFHFGSTGMAIMKKLSPMGTTPNPPRALPQRRLLWLQRVRQALLRRMR